MSEYQYYEFQAIDRQLTDEEQKALRGYSGRARINPTRFVNSYSYGDFRGDESEWMAKYFDAFVYMANWGTHRLMLRLPASLLPSESSSLEFYIVREFVSKDCGRMQWFWKSLRFVVGSCTSCK